MKTSAIIDSATSEQLPIKRGPGNPNIKNHGFKAGQSGNPAGRQKGSRNKLAESFVSDFLFDWEIGGADAIEKVRKNDPSTYLRVAASILPKELNIRDESTIIDKIFKQLTLDETRELLAGIRAVGIRARDKEIGNTKVIGVESKRL